jgi:AbrB family looped-hinge helix DNA binding protein
VGIRVGMTESVLDSKGRVLIPEEIRKKARLTAGSKVKLRLEGDDTLKITNSIPPKKFIEELEGEIKRGFRVKKEEIATTLQIY